MEDDKGKVKANSNQKAKDVYNPNNFDPATQGKQFTSSICLAALL